MRRRQVRRVPGEQHEVLAEDVVEAALAPVDADDALHGAAAGQRPAGGERPVLAAAAAPSGGGASAARSAASRSAAARGSSVHETRPISVERFTIHSFCGRRSVV